VTTLPLNLETVSPGFAALTAGARVTGAAVAHSIADALSAELGAPVRIEALAVAKVPSPALGVSALTFDLADPGSRIVVEVDARLASGLAALLCGADGDVAPARLLVPAERAALELLGLVAASGACRNATVAAQKPRLVADGAQPRGALAVELAVEAGALRGSARALVSPAAVSAVRASTRCALPDVEIPARLRRGTVTLSDADAKALRPGDVALLDTIDCREALALPGGLVLRGRLEGDRFTVEERTMLEWNGSYPIALSVEIAQARVALRDLGGLEPGGILPLNVGRDGRVTLRVGDLPVGRGELVEVDGALAVRITGWQGVR
jgi:flagellar motor switch/type III secretory pathway protein FliN